MQQILTQLVQGTKRGGEDDGQELHNVTCEECGDNPIRDDRYKCLQCDNFNLCAGCFERRAEPKKHKSGHLLVHFRLPNELFGRTVSNDDVTIEKLKEFYVKEVNKSVICDGCKVSDFVGLRFKCDSCPDYDLCLKCATTGVTTNDHKLTHPLILNSRRVIVQISINDIELGEKLGSGNFGAVHKARWISKNRPVACKIIVVPDSKEPNSLEKSFAKEVSAYIELSGGYILKTKFAIIQNFAWSGFGSTIHQIAWAFGMALAENRIAVYETPGYWFYGDCNAGTPDCVFLPITNCSIPSRPHSNQTINISAHMGEWPKPIHPPIFENRTFNWYHAQLLFYLMRYKSETLTHVQNTIAQYFQPPLIDLHHPYIAVYVRRSDKVKYKEMCQAYTLKQYFDLFDFDAQANITRVYINSEDEQVFNEFIQINKQKQGYYKLLCVKATRNVIFASFNRMTKQQRGKIVLEFLTDLFIEANADLHVGTLTSNWCRLIDGMRLALGKIIPYYTPENRYLMNT
ncbi:unnamed protein product, partial [Rotaria sp. Silwood1]